jgi:hypothetical protein
MIVSSRLVFMITWFMRGDRQDASHYRGIYFKDQIDDRKPQTLFGRRTYGMEAGIWVGWFLFGLDLLLAYFGCACIFGNVWACRA